MHLIIDLASCKIELLEIFARFLEESGDGRGREADVAGQAHFAQAASKVVHALQLLVLEGHHSRLRKADGSGAAISG